MKKRLKIAFIISLYSLKGALGALRALGTQLRRPFEGIAEATACPSPLIMQEKSSVQWTKHMKTLDEIGQQEFAMDGLSAEEGFIRPFKGV